MGHLPDAVAARGRLSFDELAFGDVDALALAMIVYPDVGDACAGAPAATLRDLAAAVSGERYKLHTELLRLMAEAPRYAGVRVGYAVSVLSEEDHLQFAAFCCDIAGIGRVLCYRGTDGTLAGWHEDFAMCYECPVSAQIAALLYLEEAARGTDAPLYLTGHSKGGNLSAYAAACASPALQERIVRAWSFDGPGFDPDTAAGEGCARILSRLRSVLPEASVIGLLLGCQPGYAVVRSDAAGLRQHDPFTWRTEGTELEYTGETSFSSRIAEQTVREGLSRLSPEERRRIVDRLFEIAEASGAHTTAELRGKLLTEIPRLLLSGDVRIGSDIRGPMARAVSAGAASAAQTYVGGLFARAVRALSDRAEKDTGPADRTDPSGESEGDEGSCRV
ncbi:MAG: DUF2974 domain-containing protein [Clostridia bacterium]|nr:DUF2974 domain-containing protein [Clostridia bacterium]